MFCKGCGKSVDTSAAACPHCGRDVDSLSGGTGFWDLLKVAPDQQVSQEGQKQPAQAPAEGIFHEGDIAALREQHDLREGTTQRRRHHAKQEENQSRRRNIVVRRINPLVIVVCAAVCALIVAVALVLAQCSHAGDGEQISDESQAASLDETGWIDSEASRNDSSGESWEGENRGQIRDESKPLVEEQKKIASEIAAQIDHLRVYVDDRAHLVNAGYQDASDYENHADSQSGVAENSQSQTPEKQQEWQTEQEQQEQQEQQEEGTKNGQ